MSAGHDNYRQAVQDVAEAILAEMEDTDEDRDELLTRLVDEYIDWRPMVKSQLHSLGRKNDATKRLDNRAKDLQVLRVVLRKHPDCAKGQQEHWCQITGKSRASFFSILARHRNEHGR